MELSKGQKKNNKNGEIKTELVFRSSTEANFRLFQALKMLLSEDDIKNYLLNKELCQQKK